MKTPPSQLTATLLLAVMGFAGTVKAQHIDASTGLPATGNQTSAHIDPLTGLQVSNQDGKPLNPNDRAAYSSFVALADRDGWPAAEVDEMMISGRYDEALQTLRSYVHRDRKGKGWLDALLIKWFSLCDKFPDARTALIETKEQDIQEFSRGGGSHDLFLEVRAIDHFLQRADPKAHPDAEVAALFKTIQGHDQQLARQCYPEAEWSLAQTGDYQLCLDYIGDPQARFGAISNQFVKRLALVPRFRADQLQSQQRQAEIQDKANQMRREYEAKAQQFRQEQEKNLPAPPFTPPPPPAAMPPRFTPPQIKQFDLGQAATNDFTAQTHTLVEILVGAGRKTDAEKIRDQAVTVLDCEGLRSAVADAEAKIKQ